MSKIDLEAVKAGLRTRALETVAAIAADADVGTKAVEAALLTLGDEFDPELDKARKRLRLTAMREGLVPLVAERDKQNSEGKALDDEAAAMKARHESEATAMQQQQRAKFVEVMRANRAYEAAATEIRNLEAEIGA